MKFGMSDAQYELLEQLVITPLKSRGAEVFIFGSRATGRHHPHSDVDLLFKLPKSQLPVGFLSELKESIEESKFPFTVDIVSEDELASSYRGSVESQLKAL